MKRTLFMLVAALGTLGTLASVPAKAVEFGVGPGGVYVGDDDGRYYRNYREYGDCRTVVEHRTNRFGEDVTIRRRICD
ncbi:hypothetical protein [Bradyrhizobium centrolobii]|uniref:hypothetical protein n=1 Tax=Bradyrhizobium centrolobii TaxID=1505087 RepID=UPI000AEB7020|nr:hypothetical protein [Bradyrhizobium centrolobii]